MISPGWTMPVVKKMRLTQMNCVTQTDVSWTYYFPFVLCGSSPVDDRELQNLTATAARLQIPVMVETDGLRLHDPCRGRIKVERPVGGIVARGPAQVGPAQISGNQVGPCQACLAEIRPLQVGA